MLQDRRLHGLLLMLLALAITALLNGTGVLSRLEGMAFNWRSQLLRSEARISEQVSVILIDEASLETLNPLVGRWPWPRSLHADILDFLSLGRPRAVVFDILFTEHERAAGGQPQGPSPGDLRLAGATAEADTVLHAMQVLPLAPDEHAAAGPAPAIPEEVAPLPVGEAPRVPGRLYTHRLPYPRLYRAAAGLGVVNAEPDPDGIHRRLRLLHPHQGQFYPNLGLAAALTVLQPQRMERAPGGLRLDGLEIPLDEDESLLLNPYGKVAAYSVGGLIASAQALAQGDIENLLVDPAEFQDKLVFIGASAAGLDDLKATSMGRQAPGVMLHATAASNLLAGDLLRPGPAGSRWLAAAALAVAACAAVLGAGTLWLQLVVPLGLAAGYTLLGLWAFDRQVLLDLTTPLTALSLSAGGGFVYLAFTEGRDKRRVRRMLSQYVSPGVLQAVMAHHRDQLEAEVGSEECLSILFSDIRNFTRLSETLPAAKVVEMLNHYFSTMTDVIFEHQGTIDKFIGDAIMAFWGAPIRETAHADKAVSAAIIMLRRLDGVNRWLQEHGYGPIGIGIGIHTGDVVLGNIGSSQKLDYTVIGDNVNLASRLEGLTKQYGVPIILSEATRQRLRTPIPCYTLDRVQVKGKRHPIPIYAPIPDREAETASSLARISAEAFAAYRRQDWDQAEALYRSLPDGPYPRLFLERCRHFRLEPPPTDWDGVYVMATK